MNKNSIYEIFDYYLGEKRKGKDFTEIRKELVIIGLEEDAVKEVLCEIDKQILLEETSNANIWANNELILIGAVLIGVGVIFTLGTFIGLFNTGKVYLVMYGPIIGGAGVLITGLRKKRNIANSDSKLKSPYFRRRE